MIPIKYNTGSIRKRGLSSTTAAIGIALAVFVVAGGRMLSAGIRNTLVASGNNAVAIVIQRGSDSELTSAMSEEGARLTLTLPGVATDNGAPIGSPETVVVVGVPRIVDGRIGNVSLRGVSSKATKLRPEFKTIVGRMPREGTQELAVGRRLLGRFRSVEIGGELDMPNGRKGAIVGVFEDGGSSYESEIWGDRHFISSSFGREGMISSVRVRLAGSNSLSELQAALEPDKRLTLEALPERQFYERQADGTAATIGILGGIVAFFFAIAAMIAAAITMNAALAKRTKEIGTLRALGFSRTSIICSLLMESCLLALIGGTFGTIAALGLGEVQIPMTNLASFSEMLFKFHATPGVIGSSLVTTIAVGILGGLFPALRATRGTTAGAIRA